MSFYRFMDILDKFTIENKDIDFREIEVKCNKVLGREYVVLNKGNKVLQVITLQNEELME